MIKKTWGKKFNISEPGCHNFNILPVDSHSSTTLMELLFSYGTLQLEKVQLSSFGRLLNGQKDALIGYKLSQVEITDETVLAQSEQRFHPVAIPSGSFDDTVDGVVFEITYEELHKADEYEVNDYARILATLASGQKAWVYILREYAQ